MRQKIAVRQARAAVKIHQTVRTVVGTVVGACVLAVALAASATAAQAFDSATIGPDEDLELHFVGRYDDGFRGDMILTCRASECQIDVLNGTIFLNGDVFQTVREPDGFQFSRRVADADGPCTTPYDVTAVLQGDTLTLEQSGWEVSCDGGNSSFSSPVRFVGTVVPATTPADSSSPAQSEVPSAVPPEAPGAGAAPQVDADRELPVSQRQVEARAAVERGDRSVVPASVQTPGEAFDGGLVVALQNLALASLLVLLMVFPAQLFNSTYDENHARVEAAVGRLVRRRRPGLAGEPPEPPPPEDAIAGETPVGSADRVATDDPVGHENGGSVWSRQIAAFGAVAVVGAVLGGLLDPRFGVNATSLALVLGVFLSVVVGVVVGGIATQGFRRTRRRPVDWFLRAVPSGLVIAALCVLVSRLVHFEPGYLYGLVGGVTFAVALERREEGQAEALVFLAGALLAVAAWFGSSAIGHLANATDPGLATLTADAFLAALFIGGIEGMLLSLVPLRFLPGHRVAKWNWPAWCALAVVISFLFVHVLLRPDSGYLGRSPTASVAVTVGLFFAFGLASVLFWAYFRWRPDPGDSGKSGGQQGELTGVGVPLH